MPPNRMRGVDVLGVDVGQLPVADDVHQPDEVDGIFGNKSGLITAVTDMVAGAHLGPERDDPDGKARQAHVIQNVPALPHAVPDVIGAGRDHKVGAAVLRQGAGVGYGTQGEEVKHDAVLLQQGHGLFHEIRLHGDVMVRSAHRHIGQPFLYHAVHGFEPIGVVLRPLQKAQHLVVKGADLHAPPFHRVGAKGVDAVAEQRGHLIDKRPV